MLGLLLAAWLCWPVIRGLVRVLVVCGGGLLLTGVAACGVPGDAGSSSAGAFDSGRSGTLTRIVDGDTVHVSIAGDERHVARPGSVSARDEEASRLRRSAGDSAHAAFGAAGLEGHRHHRQRDETPSLY
jgi:hypothetical protein